MAIASSGGGITVPGWLVGIVTASLIGLMISITGVGIVMWRDVHDATVQTLSQDKRNDDQDRRLERLESLQSDVAKLNGKMEDLVESTKATNKKVDLLLQVQLERRR